MTSSRDHLPSQEQVRTLLKNLQIHAPRLLYHSVQKLRPFMTSDLDPFQVQDHVEGLIAALRESLSSSWTSYEELLKLQGQHLPNNEEVQRIQSFAEELNNLRSHIASSHGEASLFLLGWESPFPHSLEGMEQSLRTALEHIRTTGFSLPSPPYDYLPGWSPRGLESLCLRLQKRLRSLRSSCEQPLLDGQEKALKAQTEPLSLYSAAEKLLDAMARLAGEELTMFMQSSKASKHSSQKGSCHGGNEGELMNSAKQDASKEGQHEALIESSSAHPTLAKQGSGGDVFRGNTTIVVIS